MNETLISRLINLRLPANTINTTSTPFKSSLSQEIAIFAYNLHSMKSLLFSVLFFLFLSPVFSQVVVFINEDFNSGFPSGWQVIDNDGLTPNAQVSTITSGFGYIEDEDSTSIGDSIIACTSWFTPTGTADNYLILPQISLENHGNILYWDVKSEDPSFPDGYEVLVSRTLPVIDSFYVDTLLFYTDAELPMWTQRSVSLDSFVNETIYIAFHHFSTNKFILKFDNIRVTADTTLSISEIHDNLSFGIYPNPSNENINIELKNDKFVDLVTVYNINGEIVLIHPNSNSISVSSFAEGMYFVEVLSGNSRGVKRIVVQR